MFLRPAGVAAVTFDSAVNICFITISPALVRSCKSRCKFLWLVLLFLASQSVASEPTQELNRAVAGFYNAYMKMRVMGIPQEKELANLRPYVSTSLYNRLREANQAEQRYQKANPHVPPLVEGDLFSSLFEGANAFRALSCEPNTPASFCWIEFTYVDPRDKSSFRWKDKAYVVREGGRLVVDDIEYLGDWQFMHKGRLKDVLKAVAEEGKKQ